MLYFSRVKCCLFSKYKASSACYIVNPFIWNFWPGIKCYVMHYFNHICIEFQMLFSILSTKHWYVHWKTFMHAPTWQVTSVQTFNLHHWRSSNINIIGLIVFNGVVIYSSSLHSSLIIFNHIKSGAISTILVFRADNRL